MNRIDHKFIEYPEVIIDPFSPYCDCREKEFRKYAIIGYGPHYCPKHNVIILECFFLPKDPEEIFEIAIEIVNHETMHWIFCKVFSESISLMFEDLLENKEWKELISNK